VATPDVTTVLESAVSVIDVACAALGRDPMASGLRVIDALANVEPLRGPGPLLVLQTYSTEILASVADRLPKSTVVTVLHHVGLSDEAIVELSAGELVSFGDVDHLTSLWIESLRTAGGAMDDLVALMRRLRAECPWDQEQTHASLTRHLLEESYETLDALEAFVRVEDSADGDEAAHVEEELGDLLFQIVFHAELGDEEEIFTLATIADAVRDKLIGRHPHVFGDVHVNDSNDVAARWEILKRDEKGRESVTDGIAWQLPALVLYTKLLRKASLVELRREGEDSRASALDAVRSLSLDRDVAEDAQSSSNVDVQWGDAIVALVELAQWAGVDLEGVLRERARQLRDEIRNVEALPPE
jgi:MazG family protein